MKKLFTILAFAVFTTSVMAQNLYVVGRYKQNNQTIAAVYKNGERLYSSFVENDLNAIPITIACDSEENVYWMVNRKQGSTFRYTEIYKNDQLYVSTEGTNDIAIADIYCLNDTLFYTGYQTNDSSIKVATVWKGNDFMPHWILGDNIHDSQVYDADIDKWTGIPYFCGYINEDKQRACVWEGSELLFTCQETIENGYQNTDTIISSYANVLTVDDGCIYALGCVTLDSGWDDLQALWNNGQINRLWGYEDPTFDICYSNGTLYETFIDGYGMLGATGVNLHSYSRVGVNKFRAGNYDIYLSGEANDIAMIWKNGEEFLQIPNCSMAIDVFVAESPFHIDQSEWYYEIEWENGSVTYQHLEYMADTTIGTERPKIIIRSNTHYDRDEITEVTHEYVFERDGKVYWWNKDLEEFTVLYDLAANAGDEWEIKVGLESLTMHVDAVEYVEYEGRTFRVLRVSDDGDLFSGDIVCGIGHLTSFFPERLMLDAEGFRVDGLRCYWVDEELIFKDGEEDCDAIYVEWHGIEEDGPSTPSTGSGTFMVFPNPTNGVLFVETRLIASLPDPTYRITNLMGQTLLQGHITTDCQQINIENLPEGMYFITIGETTVKFAKQ